MNVEQFRYCQQKLAYEIDVLDLSLALRERQNVQLLDVRSVDAFQKGHIAKAIHLFHESINFSTTIDLNKKMLYVCYGEEEGCLAATKAVMKLVSLGFNVREFSGGMNCWRRDGYAIVSCAETSSTDGC